LTERGLLEINTPCDRDGSFEPQIVRKRQRRFDGFDDKILALYARRIPRLDLSHADKDKEQFHGSRSRATIRSANGSG
jgi:hypothetical protein